MAEPTIIDIAQRAGVSKSLVSLALRGSPRVSPRSRAAILRAVRELGYRPNAMARGLSSRRTGVLGVMLSDLHNPFFAEVMDGVDQQAGEAGLRTLIATGHRDPDQEATAVAGLLELRVEALILAGPRLDAARIADAAATIPVVLISRASRAPGVDSIVNDDGAGAALAVDHLVALGHRRIAHIDGGQGAGAPGRRRGYERAMRRNGLAGGTCAVEGDYTETGGAEAAARLLRTGPPPTAIFAANDLSALGALDALEDAGLRVPRDVSLVGYDNTAVARLRHVDLTTVDQPRHAMGRAAVQLLLERRDGRTEPRHMVVQPSLVTGSTTAPPRPESRRGKESRP